MVVMVAFVTMVFLITNITIHFLATSVVVTLSNFATIIIWVTKVASVSWLLWLRERVGCVSLWEYSFFWRNSPQWARASSFTRFLEHTQRRTTVGRTPLDE
jgi:hypothetical protein